MMMKILMVHCNLAGDTLFFVIVIVVLLFLLRSRVDILLLLLLLLLESGTAAESLAKYSRPTEKLGTSDLEKGEQNSQAIVVVSKVVVEAPTLGSG